MTTAILLATAAAAAEGGGPAAALDWGGTRLCDRLAAQLRELGAQEVVVLAREPLAGAETSSDLAADLRRIAAIARAAPGPVVIAQADVVTQREALAGLLLNPGIGTGGLSSRGELGRPFAFGQRSARGRVVSAASPYHATGWATSRFLGVLKVAPGDVPVLADAAERMAALVDGPLPAGWEADLERKSALWRDAGASEEDIARRAAAAGEDATALLVVGLVRSGIHVGSGGLRELFWARPLSAAETARAREDIEDYDEDRALLDSAVKAADGFFTSFFVSPYSKYIARWAARRGLTPNQITTVSLGLGALAAAAFATGERWGLITGAVLLQIAFTTDCVDGQLARYTRSFSKFGAWLDSVFDRSKEYLVFAGLAIGASRAGDPVWALAGAALALQTVRHTFDFSFAAAQHQVLGSAKHPPLQRSGDGIVAGGGERSPAAEAAEIDGWLAAPPATLGGGPAARLLGLWRSTERWSGSIWIKRMLAFPIGERFAVISVTAALFAPRITFTVLLAWGGFAMAYGLTGRGLRALAR